MKKHFFYAAVIRPAISRLAITAVMIVAGSTLHAQTSQVKQGSPSPTASVKYMGSRQDMLSVAVQYDNAKGQPFTITVRDQDGYELFEGNFTEKKFNKTFRMPGPDITKIVFTIRNAHTHEVQSFEVKPKKTEEIIVQRNG